MIIAITMDTTESEVVHRLTSIRYMASVPTHYQKFVWVYRSSASSLKACNRVARMYICYFNFVGKGPTF